MSTDPLARQLQHTLQETALPALGERYRGKVRDVYRRDDRLILTATDRLCAFLHILTTHPFKREVRTRTATCWVEKRRHVVKNYLRDVPDQNVCLVQKCERIGVEVVVR